MQKLNQRSILNVLPLLILITFLTLISGCSSVKDLQIFTKEVQKTPLNLDAPKSITMDNLKWYIITRENYEKVFGSLKKHNKDVVLFGLTDDDYEKLAINFAQVRKYIILNRSVLQKYKDYYEGKNIK